MNFGLDATTAASIWAVIALVVFLGLALYFGIHKAIASALDKRIAQVETDLAEAERLRNEAQALLADYERRRIEAEKEAADIVRAAQDEAERLTAEAGASIEQMIARRTKTVEEKIAQAEVQAIAEVRARAADLTIAAARIVLQNEVTNKGEALVDQAIAEVASRLN